MYHIPETMIDGRQLNIGNYTKDDLLAIGVLLS